LFCKGSSLSLKRSLLVFAALIGLASCPVSSSAAIQLGAKVIVANNGEVVARYMGHTAGLTSELYLDSPSGVFTGVIFNNHTTPVNTTVSLGTFTAGTELIFRLHVFSSPQYDFYSGPADRNPDNFIHAGVDTARAGLMPGETFVGFEDLYLGGDVDYDDLQFAFTNVAAQAGEVPEPATLAIWSVLGGVATVFGIRRKRAAAK
jgi:hypothetical protein